MDMHRERPAACREIACEIGFLRFSSISIKSSESSVAALLRELRSLLALPLLKVCNHIWCCLSSQPVELARVAARSTRPMRTGRVAHYHLHEQTTAVWSRDSQKVPLVTAEQPFSSEHGK